MTRTCLDRTGEKGEDVVGATAGVEFFQPFRRPAKDDQWQRDGFTVLMSVPSDTGGTNSEVDGRKQKEARQKIPHPRASGGPYQLWPNAQPTLAKPSLANTNFLLSRSSWGPVRVGGGPGRAPKGDGPEGRAPKGKGPRRRGFWAAGASHDSPRTPNVHI